MVEQRAEPPRRVLLVDDDEDLRMVAELSLGEVGGFAVTLCADGPAAMEAAAAARFDVVLVDHFMEPWDGPELIGRLREQPGYERVPVIFLTGREGFEEEARALGAIGVIAKPFDPFTLADQVRALVDAAS